jgi:hypothetical protein
VTKGLALAEQERNLALTHVASGGLVLVLRAEDFVAQPVTDDDSMHSYACLRS